MALSCMAILLPLPLNHWILSTTMLFDSIQEIAVTRIVFYVQYVKKLDVLVDTQF